MKNKTLFAGLDNSGKTSIILTLQRKFSLLDSIRPTIGINQEITTLHMLGMEITKWDLGGQKKYRDRYFKEKYFIFSKAHILYYIIDMLDPDRYDESLQYLANILKTYEDMNESPLIFVCFHKVDPNLRKNLEIHENIKMLEEKIDEMKNNFDMSYFSTSIHDEPTVIEAFSEGFVKISEKTKMINTLLKEYAKTTYSSATLLLDEHSFIIGTHFTQKKYKEICQIVAPRFFITMERLGDYSLTTDNMIVNLTFDDENSNEDEKKAIVFLRDFKINGKFKLYIVSLSTNVNAISISLKFLPELAKKLQNLMLSFQFKD